MAVLLQRDKLDFHNRVSLMSHILGFQNTFIDGDIAI